METSKNTKRSRPYLLERVQLGTLKTTTHPTTKNVFKLVNPGALPEQLRGLADKLSAVTTDRVDKLATDYLTGIGWVFNYYTKGDANPDFIYKNRYAPLIHSLARITSVPSHLYEPSKEKTIHIFHSTPRHARSSTSEEQEHYAHIFATCYGG